MKFVRKLLLASIFVCCGFMASGNDCEHNSPYDEMWINYESSSYLVERTNSGTVSYTPDRLQIVGSYPWVSGKPENSGVGEYINISCNYDEHLVFAFRNGFQSFSNSNLYSENTRVKTFEITNTENGKSATVTVRDIPDTQLIDVRPLLDEFNGVNLKFEVKAVYAGSKYKDLCIDSIRSFFVDNLSSGEVSVATLKVDKLYDVEKKANTYKLVTGFRKNQYGGNLPYGSETLSNIIANTQSVWNVTERTKIKYAGSINGMDIIKISDPISNFDCFDDYIIYNETYNVGWVLHRETRSDWCEEVYSYENFWSSLFQWDSFNTSTSSKLINDLKNDLKNASTFKDLYKRGLTQ